MPAPRAPQAQPVPATGWPQPRPAHPQAPPPVADPWAPPPPAETWHQPALHRPASPPPPREPWEHATGGDVLPSHGDGDGAPARRSGMRWLVAGVAAVVSLALVAGVSLAVRGLYGGGAQPEDALPPGAVAFAKIDFNPSMAQKIDAVRFVRKFPALRDKVASDDADLRATVFESLAPAMGWNPGDYATHVEPWLGHRLGVGLYLPQPPANAGDERLAPVPDVIVALQVSDEDAARDGLGRLFSSFDATEQKPSYVIADGYALLTLTESAALRAAGPKGGAGLAADEDFTSDMAGLGDGVAAAWVDMDAIMQGIGSLGEEFSGSIATAMGAASGRASYVVRFDGPDILEVKAQGVGSTLTVQKLSPLKGFTALPERSVAAVGLADGEQFVPHIFEAWQKVAAELGEEKSFNSAVSSLERELDVELPDDAAVLLGSNLVASLHNLNVAKRPVGDAEVVGMGARITTDGRRAMQLLGKIEAAMAAEGAEFPIVRREVDGGVVVASTEQQADQLSREGRLGENELFREVVPEVDDANVAFWVDMAAVAKQISEGVGEAVPEDLEPVKAVGATGVLNEDGSSSFRLRVVVR